MTDLKVRIGRVVVEGAAGPVDGARLGRLLEVELGRRAEQVKGTGSTRVELSRLQGTLAGAGGEAELAAELARLVGRSLERRGR